MSYLSVTQISTSGNADYSYSVYLVDASTNNITINIPDCTGTDGEYFIFTRKDSNNNNTLTLVPYGSQTIDGNSSVNVPISSTLGIISINNEWKIYINS